jgi:hypothetical protein
VFGNEYADLRSKQGAEGNEGFIGSPTTSLLKPIDMENLISMLPVNNNILADYNNSSRSSGGEKEKESNSRFRGRHQSQQKKQWL